MPEPAVAEAQTTLRPQDLDQTDKKLLTVIQADFPLSVRPYEAFGKRLGLSEAETIERVRRLKAGRILRQVGAIFDTRRLGYQSSLVAARYSKERLDEAAGIVSAHPGVSHNYGRNHAFNLWYTIALPPGVSMERTIDRLHALSGAAATRLLPTLKLFKIGVQLDVAGESRLSDETTGAPVWSWVKPPEAADLTERQVRLVRLLQRDLPIEPEPFERLAEGTGFDAGDLVAAGEAFLKQGVMRRYSAVIFHRSAGFVVNGMAVWKVPLNRVMELGPVMGGFRGVTHCYQRPTYDDWPYTVFTMIHARTGPECRQVVDRIAEKTGINDFSILYSVKEYKKMRVRYFTTELDAWNERYLNG